MTDFPRFVFLFDHFLKNTFLNTSIVLMCYMPAGTFFSQKDDFLKNKHCAYVVYARRGFFPQKMNFQLYVMLLVYFLMI